MVEIHEWQLRNEARKREKNEATKLFNNSEKVMKSREKTINKLSKSEKKSSSGWKPISKSIIKKEPQATYTIESNPYRNSSFNKAWNKESMLKWS